MPVTEDDTRNAEEWGHLTIPAETAEGGRERHGSPQRCDTSAAPASGPLWSTSSSKRRWAGLWRLSRMAIRSNWTSRPEQLEVLIPEAEIKSRLAQWKAPAPPYTRGYGKLFLDHILQADRAADFDFLRGARPARWKAPPTASRTRKRSTESHRIGEKPIAERNMLVMLRTIPPPCWIDSSRILTRNFGSLRNAAPHLIPVVGAFKWNHVSHVQHVQAGRARCRHK